MDTHYSLDNTQFKTAFENATLAPELFSHEAHLRLAWLHIVDFGIDIAISNITNQIKTYTRALGSEDKYNETVTIAAIKVVHHFKLKANATNFKELMTEFPRLKTNFKDLLSQHYGFDVFSSLEAKSNFIQPDLLAFD